MGKSESGGREARRLLQEVSEQCFPGPDGGGADRENWVNTQRYVGGGCGWTWRLIGSF